MKHSMKPRTKNSMIRTLVVSLSLLLFGVTAKAQTQKDFSCTPQRGGFSVEGVPYLLNHTNLEGAHTIFKIFKNHRRFQITRENIKNGCSQRASLIRNKIREDYGLESTQVYFQSEATGGFVGATGANYLSGGAEEGHIIEINTFEENYRFGWEYHTAPAICVTHNNRSELYVIDNVLFPEPVPLRVWHDELKRNYTGVDYSLYYR